MFYFGLKFCIIYFDFITDELLCHLFIYSFIYFCFKDDMVDDVQSFVAASEVLKERGAYKIYVLATHGLLSSDAPRLIEDSPIDEVNKLHSVIACLLVKLLVPF